jgi:3-methyladenine DNA glycosylase AlkD
MTIQETIKALEKAGTAQNRKVYTRHGVKEPVFGVSFANLKALAKKIRTDHALAEALWKTGNHDARILATMIADPDELTVGTMNAWVKDLDNYVIADALGGLVGRTKHARKKADQWAKSKSDYVGQVGWNIVSGMALAGHLGDSAYFREHLDTIEREIHQRKNRTKHAMNMALCAIGIGCKGLQEEAIAAAKRIGKVEVDHGETGCKTPDAAAYIKRAAGRKRVHC